jgi:hypothetical protein
MLNDLIHPEERLIQTKKRLEEAKAYLRSRGISLLENADFDYQAHGPRVFTDEAVAALAAANEERRK